MHLFIECHALIYHFIQHEVILEEEVMTERKVALSSRKKLVGFILSFL